MNFKTLSHKHVYFTSYNKLLNNINFKRPLQLLTSISKFLFSTTPYIYNDNNKKDIYTSNIDLNLLRNTRTFL